MDTEKKHQAFYKTALDALNAEEKKVFLLNGLFARFAEILMMQEL